MSFITVAEISNLTFNYSNAKSLMKDLKQLLVFFYDLYDESFRHPKNRIISIMTLIHILTNLQYMDLHY